MTRPLLYEIWAIEASERKPGPRFASLTDALRYVARHLHEASFAIKRPDGRWFEDFEHNVVFPRTSHSARRKAS